MKKHFLSLIIVAIIAMVCFMFYLSYQDDMKGIERDKAQLQNENQRLNDQLNDIIDKVDSLGLATKTNGPIDLTAISTDLKQSVYKLVVWSKKAETEHTEDNYDAEDEADAYDVHVGTGFIFYESDILLTNYHVLGENAVYAVLIDHLDQRVPVSRIVLMNADLDYTIFRAEGLSGHALMPSTSKIHDGIQIVTMGNPLELDFTPSVGWITALRLQENVLQISTPITFGNSGGPVIDRDGQLCGLVFGGYKGNAMLNFAVNIHAIIHDIEIKTGIRLLENIDTPPVITQSVYNIMGNEQPIKPDAAANNAAGVPEYRDLPQITYGRHALQ
jgi:S1-C subfamily serine protease